MHLPVLQYLSCRPCPTPRTSGPRYVRFGHRGRWGSVGRFAAVTLGLALAASPDLCVAQGTPPNSPPAATNSGKPREAVPSPAVGGSSTGAPQSPVLDSERRPITAGGFVKTGPVLFLDVAKAAGLTTWHHTMGTLEKKYILDTTGSGVALLDYDNDGWLDIYMVNGSTYDALSGNAAPPHAALFHNNHDGTFTNVAALAGVTNDRWGYGVAVGDYDNDGWPDLYVTNFGKNRLYHNNHDGTFTDVAEKAGVTLGNWSTGATFGDYDGDGRLDLFVPGYIHYDLKQQPDVGAGEAFIYCQFRGAKTSCGPKGLQGEPDHLFHNNGDGTFTDVSKKAGVADEAGYFGFTGVFVDINNDGKVDLVVTDDSSPNYLYMNKGDGTFEDASFDSGFALNQQGRDQAGMGLAVGDYLNNGLVDLYTGTFSDDYKPLFRNGGGEEGFTEISPEMGMAAATYPFLTWATEFIDYDNDGWKDIFLVNGHVYPQADQNDWGTSYAQRPLLFHNVNHGTKFELMPPVLGTGLASVIPGRGAAFGDLFNDGKMDVVINSMDHVPSLMRDVSPDHHHWVGLKLIGGPKSPRDAVGATVYLTAGGLRQRADVLSGGSYESSNDQRPHFGLGEATQVDSVEIHWPSGSIEKVSLPAVDRFYTVEEGKGVSRYRTSDTNSTKKPK